MNANAVRGLISRRGSVVQWAHAWPALAATLNPLTKGPRSTGLAGIGVPNLNNGAMGESYSSYYPIRAYFTNKTSQSSFQQYGIVEAGDAQLDIAMPFAPDFGACADGLPPALLDAFNRGRFAVIRNQTTATYDRFIIDEQPWIAKAVPVPLVDASITFAFRVLIAKETY